MVSIYVEIGLLLALVLAAYYAGKRIEKLRAEKKPYPTIKDVCDNLGVEAIRFRVKNVELLIRKDTGRPYSSIVTIKIFTILIDGKEKPVSGPAYTVDAITGAELEAEKSYSTETGYIRPILENSNNKEVK